MNNSRFIELFSENSLIFLVEHHLSKAAIFGEIEISDKLGSMSICIVDMLKYLFCEYDGCDEGLYRISDIPYVHIEEVEDKRESYEVDISFVISNNNLSSNRKSDIIKFLEFDLNLVFRADTPDETWLSLWEFKSSVNLEYLFQV